MKKHPYDAMRETFAGWRAAPGQADSASDLGLGPLRMDFASGEESAPVEESLCADAAETAGTECPRCGLAEENAARLVAEAEDARLRALAEVDNIRKRLLREKEEAVRYAAAAVLSDIIPALDNLDLALEHAKGSETGKDFLVGVEMTRRLLLESLKKHGLETLGRVGDVFDPNLHEALGMADSPETPEGCVCVLLSRGYRLHERLLRPAKVLISRKAAGAA
jgi:molecular chaperone GrpE